MAKHIKYYWTCAYLLPGQPTPLRRRQVNCSWKPLLVFSNGDYKGKIFSDVFRSDENDKTFHKWGQSESGMTSIITQVCIPGQFILDPFCGAGTTGVAAIKHGCLFHGLDKDSANTAISRVRIKDGAA
jgi:site-specific DNA-methyltransferase (adenine-specific)